jgi:hypothetical protein
MAPSAIWLAVDARTKVEDIAATAHALGGVDALMLEDVARTTTPAAPLGAGTPIALLDGLFAEPVQWRRVVEAVLGAC